MPITFACPLCQQTISANEHLGGLQHRCPHCQNMVTVPTTSYASSPSAKPGPASYAPPEPRPMTDPGYGDSYDYGSAGTAGWGAVSTGLGILRIAIIVFLVATLLQ